MLPVKLVDARHDIHNPQLKTWKIDNSLGTASGGLPSESAKSRIAYRYPHRTDNFDLFFLNLFTSY